MWLTPALGATATLAAWYAVPHVVKCIGISRLSRLCARTRSLVLTYDDGPSRQLTPRLLSLLARHNAMATFFPLGRRVMEMPDLVEQVARAGHELGCHTFAHTHAWKTCPCRAIEDIAEGYRALSRWIDHRALFRPPHGKMTLATWLALRRRGASLAWWTVNSGDTRALLPDPAAVVRAIHRRNGGVILMHDFVPDNNHGIERSEFVLQVTERLLHHARNCRLAVRRLSDVHKPERSP